MSRESRRRLRWCPPCPLRSPENRNRRPETWARVQRVLGRAAWQARETRSPRPGPSSSESPTTPAQAAPAGRSERQFCECALARGTSPHARQNNCRQSTSSQRRRQRGRNGGCGSRCGDECEAPARCPGNVPAGRTYLPEDRGSHNPCGGVQPLPCHLTQTSHTRAHAQAPWRLPKPAKPRTEPRSSGSDVCTPETRSGLLSGSDAAAHAPGEDRRKDAQARRKNLS